MIQTFIDVILHLDQHLAAWSASMGPWLYVVLFLIIFCETGLIVTPFLPGDSLLFAIGALSAIAGSGLEIVSISATLIVAAILGDAVNYKIGDIFGAKAMAGDYKLINKKHLLRTQQFYERYGRRAIVIARFAPILRTFAPFVAGFARMPYSRFVVANVVGGILWVTSFTTAGYFFGNIPAVKKQFHVVIIAIIVISLMPAAFEVIRARMRRPEDSVAQ